MKTHFARVNLSQTEIQYGAYWTLHVLRTVPRQKAGERKADRPLMNLSIVNWPIFRQPNVHSPNCPSTMQVTVYLCSTTLYTWCMSDVYRLLYQIVFWSTCISNFLKLVHPGASKFLTKLNSYLIQSYVLMKLLIVFVINNCEFSCLAFWNVQMRHN